MTHAADSTESAGCEDLRLVQAVATLEAIRAYAASGLTRHEGADGDAVVGHQLKMIEEQCAEALTSIKGSNATTIEENHHVPQHPAAC